MAIVPNKDGMGIRANGIPAGTQVDPSYSTPAVGAAGVPSGAALYGGELRVNTTTGGRYIAVGNPASPLWIDAGA